MIIYQISISNLILRPYVSYSTNNTPVPFESSPAVTLILENFIQGQILLEFYKKNNYITKNHQKALVHCLISYYMSRKYVLKPPDLEKIAKNIADTFKSEIWVS